MLKLNLFYEQHQLQRQRDLDPVRLTIFGGILIAAFTVVWALSIYWNMGSLRTDLAGSITQLKTLKQNFQALGPLTDLPKIKSQAQALQNWIAHRALFATQLDILRDITPLNCQIRLLKTLRGMQVTETTITERKGPTTVKHVKPTLEISFEIITRAKDKIGVLQTRDSFIHALHQEPRFRDWVKQTPDENGSTNTWNEIILTSSTTHDPQAEEMATGTFEFKIPFALKDPPKDL